MVKSNDSVNANPTGTVKSRMEYWRGQVKLGRRYRQIYGQSKNWDTYKYYYRGNSPAKVVPVHIIYAVGRALIPQVYFRSPRAHVIANKPGMTMQARVLERVDNWMIRETGLKNQLKSMILDSYLCGRGPGILGYDSEFGYNPSFEAPEIEGTATGYSEGKGGEKIEYNYNVSPGMPWFLRCNPTDYIVPWGSPGEASNQWFAFRTMRPLRDIKEDPKYKSTKNLKANYYTRLGGSDEGIRSKNMNEDVTSEYVELWQIHDQRSGKVMVISLDHPDFLRDEFDELQVEGLPTRVLGFNEDPDYFWWTPDAKLIIEQQREMNDIRTMSRYHRRVSILKILVDQDAISKTEAAKILDGDVKALIRVKAGSSGDIRRAVSLLQSHVPPELTMLSREVREDVREMVGFSRNQMGSFEESSGRRTAHEAEIVRAASMIRIDERRDIMADMLSSIVRGYNQLIFKHWNAERVIDVVGQDGARYWVRFTGPQIKAEYTYKINPEESMPSDRNVRMMEAEKLMERAAKVPGLDMPYLIESYASNIDWVDPQMLFPREGKGQNPEQAVPLQEFANMQGGQGQEGMGRMV